MKAYLLSLKNLDGVNIYKTQRFKATLQFTGNKGNVSSFETEELLSNIIFGADFDDNVFVEHASVQYIVSNCTAYMAGWVVKSITLTISCAECSCFVSTLLNCEVWLTAVSANAIVGA
ncbi:hypothetical protein HELRODRAFT_177474 [Helobdella robusta]|uniref:Uncharacterized protein n=1 Tax=Helobdella robusta TaxID=6412 RepID=T1FBR3_HELRO|nr:hypothetical protein HELRODRAFT_177474 [Helobdella robusta]ESN97839.1 hypothetical protein HELRODRAFT_177474 [Helobdella robusta]